MELNRLTSTSSGEGTVELGMLSWANPWMNKISLARRRRETTVLWPLWQSLEIVLGIVDD